MDARTIEAPLTEEDFLDALEAHGAIVRKVASLYCANGADREDLAQDIVGELWRSYPRFDARSRFSTWMYRVALNVAISWVREDRRRGERVRSGEDAVEAALANAAAPDMPAELHVLLTQVVHRLSPLERALLLLYLDGEDHAQIASILGISVTNVGTKIHRLRQRLERELAA
jgi:RNA polymerase sigma-70 factor (ECF subfamily)